MFLFMPVKLEEEGNSCYTWDQLCVEHNVKG